MLGLNGTSGNTSSLSGLPFDVQAQVQQNFPPLGSLTWSGRAAFLGYQAAHVNVALTRLTVSHSVRDAISIFAHQPATGGGLA